MSFEKTAKQPPLGPVPSTATSTSGPCRAPAAVYPGEAPRAGGASRPRASRSAARLGLPSPTAPPPPRRAPFCSLAARAARALGPGVARAEPPPPRGLEPAPGSGAGVRAHGEAVAAGSPRVARPQLPLSHTDPGGGEARHARSMEAAAAARTAAGAAAAAAGGARSRGRPSRGPDTRA